MTAALTRPIAHQNAKPRLQNYNNGHSRYKNFKVSTS